MAARDLLKLPSTIQPRPPSSTSPSLQPQFLRLVGAKDNSITLTLLHSSYLKVKVKPLHHLPKRPLAISSSLPTANPDSDASSTGKSPKWSWRTIKSFTMAELEARKLKYTTTGTEALLLGILTEGTSLTAKVLRANGVTLFKVRDEVIRLLGKGDAFFFSPEHPPLTEDAQRAIDWAIDQTLKSGDSGELTTSHLLLGIWSQVDSPGHKIMAALGFSDESAKELESLSSKPGFADE